jgi:O-antigen ligase
MHTIDTIQKEKTITLPLISLSIYLLVEYARPVFFSPFRPALIIQTCLILFLIKNASKVKTILEDRTFVIFVPPQYQAEMNTIQEEGIDAATGRDRLELWKVAWSVFLDNPIIGVGQGNLPYRLGDYQYSRNGESFWQRSISGRMVHSVYLTVLSELGIIGTLIWVLMIRNLLIKYRCNKIHRRKW